MTPNSSLSWTSVSPRVNLTLSISAVSAVPVLGKDEAVLTSFLTAGALLPGAELSHLSRFKEVQDTVNIPLLAVPPGVVTAIFPVMAPVGTVAVICVPEFTV